MSLKDRVENHPLLVICSAAVLLTGLLSVPLELWRSSQESESNATVTRLRASYEAQIADLRATLQKIPITVGNKKRELDVSSITLRTSDLSRRVTRRTEFVRGASFYALRPQVLKNWSRARMSEYAFTLETTGISRLRLEKALPPNVIRLLKKLDVYLWRRKSGRAVFRGVEGIDVLYPQILVERIDASDVPSMFANDPEAGKGPRSGNDLAQFYRAEPTGFFLLSQLNFLAVSGLPLELTTIQKNANVLYAQIDARLGDVFVNGKRFDTYYLTMQLILISTPDGLYFVKTYLPSAEPYSRDASAVTEWLSNFHVVVPD